MSTSTYWRDACRAVATRLNAPDEVFERIDHYTSDEPGYDGHVCPDPEQFVKDEIENLE